jgi:hypothetical protein
MKNLSKIFLLFFVFLASCTKSSDQSYTLKFYGEDYEDIGYSVAITSDGYVIAGELTDITRSGGLITASNKNMGIIKTGWGGNVTWKVSLGGKYDDHGTKIYQNTDGSLVCTGTFTDTTTLTPVQTDVFIVKVSASGEVQWQKKYGGSGNQTGTDIIKTSDGYMVMGSTDVADGSTGNIAGNTNIFMLKLSETGDSVESFTYGYPGNDVGTSLKADLGGGYVIFATTDEDNPGQDNDNLLLIRLNSNGNLTQSVIAGGAEDEYAADMEVLSDGYMLAYTILKTDGSQEIWVTKLKTNIYSAPYFTNKMTVTNPNSTDVSASVNAISPYRTDSFLLAGQSGKGSTGKMLIFEIDANGNQVEGHQLIKGSTGLQVAYDVTSSDDEYIIAVGKDSYDVNSMITFLKFRF